MALTTRISFKAASLFGSAVLVALLGSVAVSAWAQGGHGGHGRHGGADFGVPMMHGRMLDSIDASAAQRAQIKQISEAAAADLKTQREARRALHEQGMKLFTQPVVDANAVEALRQQMLQQHDQVSRRRMQALLDVSRVLTPEQRQQLAQKMAERKAKHQAKHQGGHHEPQGQPDAAPERPAAR